MKRVLCTIPMDENKRKSFEAAGKDCEFFYVSQDDVTAEEIAGANIIIGNVPAGKINASEKLEYYHLSSAGADAYVKPGVLSPSTLLTCSTGAYSKAVAEHGLALTMMMQKKLYLYRDAQKRGEWADFGTVTSLADSTVMVVGLGDIGSRYAKMVKALGAYVIGIKRRQTPCPDYVDDLFNFDEMDPALPHADVVFSVLPSTRQLYHVFTRERFECMKDSAIFINCGRGDAVDMNVLYDVLSQGVISAAAVDVLEQEPLPHDSPLWSLDNLVITPHVSGFFHLPETYENVVALAAENLGKYTNGQEPRNVLDMHSGYKK